MIRNLEVLHFVFNITFVLLTPDLEILSSSSLPNSSRRSLISATAFLTAAKEKSGFTVTLGMKPSSVGVQR